MTGGGSVTHHHVIRPVDGAVPCVFSEGVAKRIPFTRAELIETVADALCLAPAGVRQTLYHGRDERRREAAYMLADRIADRLSRIDMTAEEKDLRPALHSTLGERS